MAPTEGPIKPQICGLKSPSRRNAVLLGEDVGSKPSRILRDGCLSRSLSTVVLRLLKPVIPPASDDAGLVRVEVSPGELVGVYPIGGGLPVRQGDSNGFIRDVQSAADLKPVVAVEKDVLFGPNHQGIAAAVPEKVFLQEKPLVRLERWDHGGKFKVHEKRVGVI